MPEVENKATDEDRRAFLEACGKFATTVPPALTLLLSTSLTSSAIARSTGDRGSSGSDYFRPHTDKSRPKFYNEAGPKQGN